MRLLTIITFAAILCLGLSAADVTGIWKGAMETQMGATDLTITFKPGATLSGTVQAGEYEAPMENVKLDGAKISFEMKIVHGKVAYEGTVEGDEMRLNVTGTQGDKYKVVCKRKK